MSFSRHPLLRRFPRPHGIVIRPTGRGSRARRRRERRRSFLRRRLQRGRRMSGIFHIRRIRLIHFHNFVDDAPRPAQPLSWWATTRAGRRQS